MVYIGSSLSDPDGVRLGESKRGTSDRERHWECRVSKGVGTRSAGRSPLQLHVRRDLHTGGAAADRVGESAVSSTLGSTGACLAFSGIFRDPHSGTRPPPSLDRRVPVHPVRFAIQGRERVADGCPNASGRAHSCSGARNVHVWTPHASLLMHGS
jgi:hypothetical protein